MGGWTIIWSHHSYEHTWVFTIRGYWGWGRVKQSSDHTTAQHIWGATQSVIIHADKSQSICWLKHAMKCQSISRLLMLWHGEMCQAVIWWHEACVYVCISCIIGWESWWESVLCVKEGGASLTRSKETLGMDPWGIMVLAPVDYVIGSAETAGDSIQFWHFFRGCHSPFLCLGLNILVNFTFSEIGTHQKMIPTGESWPEEAELM